MKKRGMEPLFLLGQRARFRRPILTNAGHGAYLVGAD